MGNVHNQVTGPAAGTASLVGNFHPALRVFTTEEPPPHGESMWLMDGRGWRCLWNGKRWRPEGASHMEADAWPPEDAEEGEQFFEFVPAPKTRL